jgi:thymidylate synthase
MNFKTIWQGVKKAFRSDTWEYQYIDLVRDILENGDDRMDRTGTGTRSVFGRQLDIPLYNGFPAVTGKKLAWRSVLTEDLFFVEGSNDERRLAELLHGTRDPLKRTIWTDNAEANYWKPKAKFEGDLGRVYGVQWRHWNTYQPVDGSKDGDLFTPGKEIDQLAEAINKIKNNPADRRIIVSAWNVGELDQMALPPCHMLFQLYVENGRLSCQMYQRSVDTMLGLPFNIASYALLTHMIAKVCNLKVGRLIMCLGDVHIYKDHLDGAREQIKRKPYDPPALIIEGNQQTIDDFKESDFCLSNYTHHKKIEMKMST